MSSYILYRANLITRFTENKPPKLVASASVSSAQDIFSAHLPRFYRLTLALCGDIAMAEHILVQIYERATTAGRVQPAWHVRWIRHRIIQSSINLSPKPGDVASSRRSWSRSLPSPFRATLPRALFVLKTWEGIPLTDVCRYCSLSRPQATALLLETWALIRARPACLSELASALTFPANCVAGSTEAAPKPLKPCEN